MPQNILPDSFLYEMRKCPRCRKQKQFLKNDTRKYCGECLVYAQKYKHAHKVFKLSKEDLAQIEKDKEKEFKELSAKFGTTQPDCVLWRKLYEQGRKSDFRYNHIQGCMSCSRWYALHKNDSFDLNKGMENVKDELKGYAEMFKTPEPFPEDNVYTPLGVYPMTKICSFCGSKLNEKGKCPLCDPE